MTDWFKFENKELDIPFYKNNPRVPTWGWIILLLSVPLSFIIMGMVFTFSEILGAIVFPLVMLIPLLYFTNWDFSQFFQKPSKKDILLAIVLTVCYIIYTYILDYIFTSMGHVAAPNSITQSPNISTVIVLIFSIMGEELLKLIPFLFFIKILYAISNNRKVSIIVSMLFVLILFGALHGETNNFLISIVIIGLGSIFEMYAYIKTKNIMVSYLTHLITDLFLLALSVVVT